MAETPCGEWPIAYCGDGGTDQKCASLAALDPDMAELIEEAAINFLWNATNQRFGVCPVTIRPCAEGCYAQSTYRGWAGIPIGNWGFGNGWVPYIFNGNWYNLICGDCGTRCTHQNLSKVKLPGVVETVSSVVINGDPFTAWEYNQNYGLIRTDGLSWPKDQDMTKPLTEDDTFGVTFEQGIPVPAGGQVAAAVLACEMAKAACGSNDCRLPMRLKTIVREGVTVAVQDNFAMLQSASGPLTGIWVIDSWISSVNYSARRRSRVLTPNAGPTWKQG